MGKPMGLLWAEFLCAALCATAFARTNGDLFTCGYDKGDQCYPPHSQITPDDNAEYLKAAWAYDMKPATRWWSRDSTDCLPFWSRTSSSMS